jgi:hypothetical protein
MRRKERRETTSRSSRRSGIGAPDHSQERRILSGRGPRSQDKPHPLPQHYREGSLDLRIWSTPSAGALPSSEIAPAPGLGNEPGAVTHHIPPSIPPAPAWEVVQNTPAAVASTFASSSASSASSAASTRLASACSAINSRLLPFRHIPPRPLRLDMRPPRSPLPSFNVTALQTPPKQHVSPPRPGTVITVIGLATRLSR